MDKGFIKQIGCIETSLTQSCSSIYWCEFDVLSYRNHHAHDLNISIEHSLNRALPKRIAEYVAGRYCARQALNEYAESTPPSMGGQKQPIWPDGFWGSISHSDSIALAIVSTSQSVGIDIERFVEHRVVEETAELILTPAELSYFQGQLTSELFTLIFSTKESFYKAAFPYVKRFFSFSAIDIIDIQFEQGQLTYHINEDLTGGLEKGMTGQASFSYPFSGQVMTVVSITLGT